MAAWQAASTSTTETPGGLPGRHHHWPDFFVRWFFGRGDEERAPREVSGAVARFQNICISREAGAGAGTIARMVGKRLGWKVYDDELVEAIAHRMEVSLDEVRTLDELAPSVVQDWLLPLREEYYAPQEAYLDHLAKLIEAIGRAGDSILVGRGANYMLPRETTLTVRIIAPLKVRAIRLAERMGVTVRTARRRPRSRPPPAPVRPHDAPRQLQRSPQLRHGARLEQPGFGHRDRDHRACRRERPALRCGDESPAPGRVDRAVSGQAGAISLGIGPLGCADHIGREPRVAAFARIRRSSRSMRTDHDIKSATRIRPTSTPAMIRGTSCSREKTWLVRYSWPSGSE